MNFELLKNFEQKIWLAEGIRSNSTTREPQTTQWAKQMSSGVFYDIGANIGAYSLIAAKSNPKLLVLAFEPQYKNYYILMENIVRNKLTKRVSAFSLALADCSGINTFNIASLDVGSALSAFGEAIDYKGEKFKPVIQQDVLGMTMDDLVFRFGAVPPTYVKIDVDSIESKILRGGERCFKEHVRSVMVEANKVQVKEIFTLMEQYGFSLKTTEKHPLANNYFFFK